MPDSSPTPGSGPVMAGPLLGEQGEHDAFIWAYTPDEQPLTLTVFKPNGTVHSSLTATPQSEDAHCLVYHVTGLDMFGSYQYMLSSSRGETPRFQMHRPPPPHGTRLRIVFGSCIQDSGATAGILGKMAREGADLAMLVGDNTYFQKHDDGTTDWDTERSMMAKHLQWRKASGMRGLCANLSTLAIWDDHDYGDNDIGAGNPDKRKALHCFRRMWAQRHYGRPGTDGIFSTVRCGPVQIFLLDVRFHREPDDGKVIGDDQMRWLKSGLRATDAPVKLIVSGSQMLPAGAVSRGWECWRRDGKSELGELFTFIADEPINGVVLASGDVHLGQLMFSRGHGFDDGRRGGDLWELTSSPLTGPTEGNTIMRGSDPLFDKYMIDEVAEPNYGVIDINLEREGKEVVLELNTVSRSVARAEIGLKSLRARAPRPQKVKAFGTGREHTHALFFRGDKFVSYDIVSRKVEGVPQFSFAHWPGLDAAFDTGVRWTNGQTFFFRGNGFAGWGENVPPEWRGRLWYISANFHWPASFLAGIDAAILWPDNGKAYIFRGENYIRYDIAARSTDGNYPQPIAKWWKGLWPEGIDAAFHGPNGKVFFFRGDEFISYDVHDNSADDPLPIADHWPGLTF